MTVDPVMPNCSVGGRDHVARLAFARPHGRAAEEQVPEAEEQVEERRAGRADEDRAAPADAIGERSVQEDRGAVDERRRAVEDPSCVFDQPKSSASCALIAVKLYRAM